VPRGCCNGSVSASHIVHSISAGTSRYTTMTPSRIFDPSRTKKNRAKSTIIIGRAARAATERGAAGGNEFADLTLHVGLGTFKPMQTEEVEEHAIHREVYEISTTTQARLFDRSRRRIAVGTTSVRSIEHFLTSHGAPGADHIGDADLFIHPPRGFRGVDALITNFHAPRSTLLCLVAAFLAPGSTDGIKWLRDIYAQAVAERYRFLSYGDAMLVL
jgi:S-adenosylmethionine:tRNA ribosyltransferase-isomerase